MGQLGEVVHTIPLVYQPTQSAGPMTHPEGPLLPRPLQCMTVNGYTSVCKLATVYTVTKPKGQPTSCLIGGRVITHVIGQHILL